MAIDARPIPDSANADVYRALAAFGPISMHYRGFEATPFGACSGTRGPASNLNGRPPDSKAFDPLPGPPAATAAEIYPLLGRALLEAREVQVRRTVDSSVFATAPPAPSATAGPLSSPTSPATVDAVSTDLSLAERALRAHTATSVVRVATAASAPPAIDGGSPAAPPVWTGAGTTPLASLFRLLAEPRPHAGGGPHFEATAR